MTAKVMTPGTDWNIHDNTITGCLGPIVLDSYGSPNSLVRNNLITRGEVAFVAARRFRG
jgi:hypothetical protein